MTIGFQGEYAPGAARRLAHDLPSARRFGAADRVAARVAVIDRMNDTEDPEDFDPVLLDRVGRASGRVVFIVNGRAAPAVPDDVLCVGYKPGGPEPRPPNLLWGLDYAPVDGDVMGAAPMPAREAGRALVALGGAPDDTATRLAIDAIAGIARIVHVDLLASPVAGAATDDLPVGRGQSIERHVNLPSVAPLLRRAGIVVASYGHLAYEAIAAGAPVCLLGQKRFQADYAVHLERMGLAVVAGLAGEVDAAGLRHAIERTLDQAAALSARGPAAVDGGGIRRLADLILGAA